MKVRFFSAGTNYTLRNKKKIAFALEKTADKESPGLNELNIILCSDKSIQDINSEFLGHHYPTDVISFKNDHGIPSEIYIGLEQAQRQAKDFNVSTTMEIYRLLVHGLLHICGYDDSTPEEKAHMTGLENEYLALHFAFS